MSIEKKENKVKNILNNEEMELACSCETCEESPDCDSVITFSFDTCIVNGNVPAIGSNVPIVITGENLNCIIEQCYVDVEVPNPCDSGTTISCSVCLNRYRYVGCINYLANIPRAGESGIVTCFNGCQSINSIRCYLCDDDCIDCPPLQGFIVPGSLSAEVTSGQAGGPNGRTVILTVTVTLTLTNPCQI